MFGEKPADVDVFGLGVEPQSERVGEPDAGRDRGTEETGSVLDYDLPDESGSDLSLGEKPPRDVESRSIESGRIESRGIESGSEEERDREAHRPRRRRRGRGRRGRGEEREAAPSRHEADIEPAGEEADFDLGGEADLDMEGELSEQQEVKDRPPERGPYRQRAEESERYPPSGQRPPREEGERGGRPRRHRRGGGRGRDEAEPHRAPYQAEEDERERLERPPAQRGPAQRAARPDDEEPDDDLRDAVEELDEGQGGDLPTHKKIPTWDEAVGILIDANMANRGPDRDRGHGRGRGRR